MCRCSPVYQDGYRSIDWVATAFGECVYTPREKASFFIGLASIIFWLFAQAPQVMQNFKRKSTDSLSIIFLLAWLLGDAANLIGAFLTHQLPTQIYTAIYFVCMDVVLWVQFFWYTYLFPSQAYETLTPQERAPLVINKEPLAFGRDSPKTHQRRMSAFVIGCFVVLRVGFTVFPFGPTTFDNSSSSSNGSPLDSGRSLLDDSVCSTSDSQDWTDSQDVIGYVVGCVSACFYLGSRLPQLIKNYQRKSTEGLSYLLFFFAVMGNTTYGLSIFLWSVDGDYIISKLPWIAGSVGVLAFDVAALYQFLKYRDNNLDIADSLETVRIPSNGDLLGDVASDDGIGSV